MGQAVDDHLENALSYTWPNEVIGRSTQTRLVAGANFGWCAHTVRMLNETTEPDTGNNDRAQAVRRRARRWVLLAVGAGVVAIVALLYFGLRTTPTGLKTCSPGVVNCTIPPQSDVLSTVVPAVTAIVGVLLTAVSTIIAVLTYRMARAMQNRTPAPSSAPPSA